MSETEACKAQDTATIGQEESNGEDVSLFVGTLLAQMQENFETMGGNILSRLDEMGSRIDELEQSIAGLALEAGIEIPVDLSNTETVVLAKSISESTGSGEL